MVTLRRAYTSVHDAENAVERLLSADVPAIRIELIMGRAVEDARDAWIGTFAGTMTAGTETVGSYADIPHSGRARRGGFAGDAGTQRRGSFGDADRDTVTTYRAGVRRTRSASHRRLEKLLVDAGLDPAIATADVRALHTGRVLVLAHGEAALGDIAAVIEDRDQGRSSRRALRAAA